MIQMGRFRRAGNPSPPRRQARRAAVPCSTALHYVLVTFSAKPIYGKTKSKSTGGHAMKTSDPRSWMWSEALDMLARADRIQRQLFHPHHGDAPQSPCWEPPADVMETAHEVIVITALPGVDPATITTAIDHGSLEIFGQRVLPAELQTATIHRLELPQGCFKRRLRIPPGTYDRISRVSSNGCLIVTLHKHEPQR